jgi:hypothetical protein
VHHHVADMFGARRRTSFDAGHRRRRNAGDSITVRALRAR